MHALHQDQEFRPENKAHFAIRTDAMVVQAPFSTEHMQDIQLLSPLHQVTLKKWADADGKALHFWISTESTSNSD